MENQKIIQFDMSVWLLLFLNIATGAYAVYAGWSLIFFVLVYWLQGISIGIVNFIRILLVENYSVSDIEINEKKVKFSDVNKYVVAVIFILIYGGLHLFFIQLIFLGFLNDFLFSWMNRLVFDFHSIAAAFFAGFMFFLNHLFSYFYNRKADMQKQAYLGRMIAVPFARIMPMILIVSIYFRYAGEKLFADRSAGQFDDLMIIPFVILKTVGDVWMHIWEHHRS